jgi:Na+/H+ antiporter NhaD/arsenite permease-like protein
MLIPIMVLGLVFILIAVRKIGKFRLDIWQIMLFGALAVLFLGQISAVDAFKSINFDVILFLFGMFVIGRALEDSGYLAFLSYKFFSRTKTAGSLLLFILFGFGLLSAFLMNDTVAIIGTPIVLLFAKKLNINSKMLLLALAFSVTIGSVMSPIGNPQNLLIALGSGIQNPFTIFVKYLLVPTIINMYIAYLMLKFFYKDFSSEKMISHEDEPIRDAALANLSKISLLMVFALVFVKILFVALKVDFDFRLTYIALLAMLPILLFSRQRLDVIKKIDWYTLVFFASMFILMECVWQAGFFQEFLSQSLFSITGIPSIFAVSILLSQLISNVPLVALYMPTLIQAGASMKSLIALAAASTIAGNLLILGAASNIIIIQSSEKRGGDTLTFLDFAKIGIPLTILNALVYWLFFQFLP